MGILKWYASTLKMVFLENDFAKGFESGMGLDKDPQKEIAKNTAKILEELKKTERDRG